MLDEALARQANLSLQSLQTNVVDLEAAMDQAHASAGSDRHNRDLSAPYQQAQDDARRIESRLMNGDDVSAEDMERVQLSAQETALRARLHGLQVQLDTLQGAGDQALVGLAGHLAQFGSSRFRQLHEMTQFVHDVIGAIYIDLATGLRFAKPVTANPGDLHPSPPELIARRTSLARAQQRLAQLGSDHDLANFLKVGAEVVQAQQLARRSCKQA